MSKKVNTIDQDETIDIKKLLFKYLSYWKLYIICVVVAILGAFLFLRYATPLFKIHAQVLIAQDKNNGSPSSSFMQSNMMMDFSDLFSTAKSVNDELAILETRDLLERVVQDLQLNIVYQKKGTFKTIEIYNKSPFKVAYIPSSDSVITTQFNVKFADNGRGNAYEIEAKYAGTEFSRKSNFGDTISTPVGKICLIKTAQPFAKFNYAFTIASSDEVIEDLSNNVNMAIPDKQTDVITLDYTVSIPAKGETILKRLIDAYIERDLNEKYSTSDSALSFINSRITLVAEDLNNIESDIQNFKQANKITDISAQSQQLVTASGEYLDKLNEVEVQLNVVETMLKYLQDEKNNNRPVPALLNADPTFLALVEKYNSALIERDRQTLTIQENNPVIVNIDASIRNIRQDIIKSLLSQQQALQTSKNQLATENNQFNSLIKGMPAQERRYVNLSRERDVKQALYLYLLQKKEETAITKASNIPTASVIARPKSEYKPYFPKKGIVLCVSLILGLGAATGIIAIKNALSVRVQSREDIEEHTALPILGGISHSDNPELILSFNNGRSVIAEQFRLIRTKMEFLVPGKKCPKVLITSFMPSEGKSFITANLAHIYALAGKKVLLMELDLRKPKLSKMLNMTNNTGFTRYVIEQGTIDNYISALPDTPDVYLMGSGPIPPNPGELLINPVVPQLFSELEKRFDLIVLDTPPIGAVADAQVLMRYSDLNLYVIRQGYSFIHGLNTVNELSASEGLSNLYLIVNDVKKGSGYSYGYGYGYGEYGEDNVKQKKQKSSIK